ncbi:MGMT family protein [Nesterenkonia alkaliphila]|uniref:DNA methyltransferase n=1 Tax=Nesterenkonia alkaliphila TaxID=1463631 RepID=A0A7K1UGB8_9MICC|nr:MGMT family protein [Nesterenkonia alkaliphila]MVT25479.1 DNA methyltransferase [Nesterenkonia alkaliphila]GFZ96566.1 DNA methyltransferase [Nesterenkonia alkaliphila]
MDEETHELVREIVSGVPAGTVATYGDVAALAGLPNPRMVGQVLREDGGDIPWHRIIRADGVPAAHLRSEQLARLRAEGVLAEGQRISLTRYRWNPEGPGAG